MNQNDINAAIRLIAEFEDRALGRHNSNMFNRAEERQYPTEVRGTFGIAVKDKPEDCRVGEYCWIHGNYSPAVRIMRFRPPPDPKAFLNWNGEIPRMDTVTTWEFERVTLVIQGRRSQRREAWRRIA